MKKKSNTRKPAKRLKPYSFEAYRSVSDDAGDFDDTAAYKFSLFELREFVAQMLEDAGIGDDRTVQIEARKFHESNEPQKFVEFDSGNPSHACAYFQVTMLGPPELVAKLEAYDAEQE